MPHSRALEHSAAQTLLAALPWSAPAPWPGFKAPPSELSPFPLTSVPLLSLSLSLSVLPPEIPSITPCSVPSPHHLLQEVFSPLPHLLWHLSCAYRTLYLHPPNDFARQADFGIYILKMRKQGTERLSNWPRTTQLESAGIWI